MWSITHSLCLQHEFQLTHLRPPTGPRHLGNTSYHHLPLPDERANDHARLPRPVTGESESVAEGKKERKASHFRYPWQGTTSWCHAARGHIVLGRPYDASWAHHRDVFREGRMCVFRGKYLYVYKNMYLYCFLKNISIRLESTRACSVHRLIYRCTRTNPPSPCSLLRYKTRPPPPV
jgi:hypothetical protein